MKSKDGDGIDITGIIGLFIISTVQLFINKNVLIYYLHNSKKYNNKESTFFFFQNKI